MSAFWFLRPTSFTPHNNLVNCDSLEHRFMASECNMFLHEATDNMICFTTKCNYFSYCSFMADRTLRGVNNRCYHDKHALITSADAQCADRVQPLTVSSRWHKHNTMSTATDIQRQQVDDRCNITRYDLSPVSTTRVDGPS